MTTILLCSLIFLLSGLIQGLTGFGGGLVAIPLLCLIMDVKMAVPLCIVSGLVITTVMAYELRRLFEAPEAAVYLVATGTIANSLCLALTCPPWSP